jgi:hypothetical protein
LRKTKPDASSCAPIAANSASPRSAAFSALRNRHKVVSSGIAAVERKAAEPAKRHAIEQRLFETGITIAARAEL